MKRNIFLFNAFMFFRAGLFTLPVWIVYQEKFLTFPQIAFFSSLVLIITVVTELPTGVLADLIGKKNTMIIGAALMCCGYFVLGSFPSLQAMIIYCILVGLGESMISGAEEALVYDSLKDIGEESHFPKILANASALFQVVATMTTLIGGYLYVVSPGLPYIARGAMFLISIPFLLMMKEPVTDTEHFSLKSYIKQTILGAKEAFKNFYTAKVSVMYFLIGGLGMSFNRFFTQPYLVEIGIGDIQRSWITSFVKFAMSISLILFTRNKKLFQSNKFVLVLPILMVFSLIPISYLDFPFFIITLIGINMPSAGKGIFMGHTVNQNFDSKYRATALSTINMLMIGVYAASNYFGGLASEKITVGNYYLIMGIFTLVVLLPLAISVAFHKDKTSQ